MERSHWQDAAFEVVLGICPGSYETEICNPAWNEKTSCRSNCTCFVQGIAFYRGIILGNIGGGGDK